MRAKVTKYMHVQSTEGERKQSSEKKTSSQIVFSSSRNAYHYQLVIPLSKDVQNVSTYVQQLLVMPQVMQAEQYCSSEMKKW